MTALIAGQAADLLSFLAMNRAFEANPIAADMTAIEAILAKTALVAFVLWVGSRFPLYRSFLYQFGALAGAFGFGANTAVLLG